LDCPTYFSAALEPALVHFLLLQLATQVMLSGRRRRRPRR
jgi:hypothetical protein